MNFDQIAYFTFHEDPGHGWLEVPVADLVKVGLTLDDISPYSFISGSGRSVYLEEDLDAGVFHKAWIAKFGKASIKFMTESSNEDSFIHNLRNVR